MVDHWLGISSAEYDSSCGDDGLHTIEEALDGTDYWQHDINEIHWLILDLGQTYTIKKVRSRSNAPLTRGPNDVNIYVSDSKTVWGVAVATGQDYTNSDVWIETDTTDKDGRYIKVEIVGTEYFLDYLVYGKDDSLTIFDAYGDIAVAKPLGLGLKPAPKGGVGRPALLTGGASFGG